MEIGKQIKAFRVRRGMTQEELAHALGVTPSAVGNYERGVSFPKEEILTKLFGALGVTPNELFGAEGFSPEELAFLENYRALDSHGKELVNACLEIEGRRLREDEPIIIAARKGKGGKLVKRSGKNVRDLPDYRRKS